MSPEPLCACSEDTSRASDAFDQGTRPEASATAHRDQPVAALRPLEFVGSLGDEETPSRAERMTQRNGATVWFDTRHVRFDLLGPGQDYRGKGFIYFHDVDVVNRKPRALEQLACGWDRPYRIATDECRLDYPHRILGSASLWGENVSTLHHTFLLIQDLSDVKNHGPLLP